MPRVIRKWGREGSEEEWAQVGRNHLAYAGQLYFDEEGEEPVLIHSMQVANLPSLFRDLQRRLVGVTDGEGVRFLNLAPDSTRRWGRWVMIR
jgi:hypothetical protein